MFDMNTSIEIEYRNEILTSTLHQYYSLADLFNILCGLFVDKNDVVFIAHILCYILLWQRRNHLFARYRWMRRLY